MLLRSGCRAVDWISPSDAWQYLKCTGPLNLEFSTQISSLGVGSQIWNVIAANLHRFIAPYKPFAAAAAEEDRCSGRLQCDSWIYCCTAGRWSCGAAVKIAECCSVS
ncbi:hypothetical protein Nepgr_004027 [Nepenthes gracilis]|uniref:Uncharacterized protein n=1 Tax=Nepenthes gracilis TaxID=150966 RepID=A0AAD3XEK1_NEPGR|nr:hypothetical protein Nepgr_004027 [Nepenthes gracilis]